MIHEVTLVGKNNEEEIHDLGYALVNYIANNIEFEDSGVILSKKDRNYKNGYYFLFNEKFNIYKFGTIISNYYEEHRMDITEFEVYIKTVTESGYIINSVYNADMVEFDNEFKVELKDI